MIPRRPIDLAVALAAVVVVLSSGCRKSEPVAPAATPAPARVENAALGLAFSPLPEGMRVVRNEGATLELALTAAGVESPIAVTLSPKRESAINLVEESKAFQAEVTGAGGKFYGVNELVAPFGVAYTVRGAVDGGAVEERRIFLVHPGDADRLLTLTIRYPPGDGAAARARLQPLLDLLGALEPLPAGPTAP